MTTRSIPWPRIFAEGVAIVVSILLAFGIQAWWEGRQERELERAALRQLREEFALNRERMRISEARHRTQRDHIAAILRAIAQRGDPPRSYMIPDTVLLGGLGYRTFEPVQGALTSLISSGGIGLIQDDSLRIELASWLDAVEELREDEITDGNIRLDVNALLFDHIPLVTLDYQRGEEGLTAPSPFQADYRAVLNSVLFENLLNFRLAKKNEILAEGYEPLTSRLDLILRRIEAGLRD